MKEFYEKYFQWNEYRNTLVKEIPSFKESIWTTWSQPFKNWASEYVQDANKKTNSYDDLVKNYFKQKIIEQINSELETSKQELLELKLVDEKFQGLADEAIEWSIKIVTTLLYEIKRNAFNALNCQLLTYYIIVFDESMLLKNSPNSFLNSISTSLKAILLNPVSMNSMLINIEKQLQAQEEALGSYFGSYASDDSDAEEEKKMESNSTKLNFTQFKASKIIKQLNDFSPVTKGGTLYVNEVTKPSPSLRWEANVTNLHYDHYQDLEKLNQLLRGGVPLSEALKGIKTKFYIAKFRGIAYNVKHWGKKSRSLHRALNEINRTNYSAAVYAEAGINSIDQYYKMSETERAALQMTLQDKAEQIRKKLLDARKTPPVKDDKQSYIFKSKAHQIQSLYTRNYDEFHRVIKTPHFGAEFVFQSNPFLSTGNVPYHALNYAYGLKFYDSAKETRLRPRWRKDGRAERPYSGKVYVTLHSISDFSLESSPFDVVKLHKEGELNSNIITNVLHERECTFLSYIDAKDVKYQHTAKYPSFHGDYKQIYYYKYGLSEEWYNLFKIAITSNKPHTKMHKHYKNLLASWLCSYHEVRLLGHARRIAESLDGVIVYYNNDGTFGFEPDNPNTIGYSSSSANQASRKKLDEIIHFRSALYQLLDQNKIDPSNVDAVYKAVQQEVDLNNWPSTHFHHLNKLYDSFPKPDLADDFAKQLNFDEEAAEAEEKNASPVAKKKDEEKVEPEAPLLPPTTTTLSTTSSSPLEKLTLFNKKATSTPTTKMGSGLNMSILDR